MTTFLKLQSIFNEALAQATKEGGILLGKELASQPAEALLTNKLSYFSDLENASFVVGVQSREEYSGVFYLVFALSDAIVMSSSLLGIPPNRILEKKRLAIMEADDCDAFAEILNQMIGSFNSVFQPRLPNKVHLKLLPSKKFIPQQDQVTAEEPVPEGEYLLLMTQLEMPGQELNRLNLLIPLSLANLFDPEGGAEAIAPVAEAAPSPTGQQEGCAPTGQAGARKPATADGSDETPATMVLILDDDQFERQKVTEALSAAGVNVVAASLDDNIKELFAAGGVKVALISLTNADDRELAVSIKLRALAHDSQLVIIMCAKQWTRTGVLKALKFGARDIVLKPCSAGELLAKVEKFLKAA
jgi:ActR/RegA family two-component response regulator